MSTCPLFAGPVYDSLDSALGPPNQLEQQQQQQPQQLETINPSQASPSSSAPPLSPKPYLHTNVQYQDYQSFSIAPSPSALASTSAPTSQPQRSVSGCTGSCGSSSASASSSKNSAQKSTPNSCSSAHVSPKLESPTVPPLQFDRRSRSVERDMEDLLGGGHFGSYISQQQQQSLSANPTTYAHDSLSNIGSPSNSASPPADDEGHSHEQITPFISKLVHILNHPEHQRFIRWNAAGDAFVFAHTRTELQDIFARLFRHSNCHSFVRQLNIYGFQRLTTLQLLTAIETPTASHFVDPTSYPDSPLSAADFSGFTHPLFFRDRPGQPCDLSCIKPRTKPKRKSAPATASADEAVAPPKPAKSRRKTARDSS
ncbi:winged helix DNA-binding domain-containing protein [Meredithblackwellia eburnea MCA 4105]